MASCSNVHSLLLRKHEITRPSYWSLVCAYSNGKLTETKVHISTNLVTEFQQQQVLCNERRNPAFCILAVFDLVLAGMAKNEVKAWKSSNSIWSQVDLGMSQHTGWVRAIASQGVLVFTASCSSIKVWKLHTSAGSVLGAERITELQLFKGDILSLAVNDHHLFCGTSDGFLHAWELPRDLSLPRINLHFRKVRTLKAHHGSRVISLLLLDSEEKLVTGGDDGSIKLWLGEKLLYSTSTGHKNGNLVRAGSYIYGNTGSASICKWDIASLTLLKTICLDAPAKLLAAEDASSAAWILAAAKVDGEICLLLET